MLTRNSQFAFMSSEERAYTTIRRLILSRKYYEGYRFKYDELAKMLAMSKTPIVSALSRLTQEGLVEHKQNSGYKVARISGGGLGRTTKSDISSLADTLSIESTDGYDRVLTPPTASLNQAVYDVIKGHILKSKFVPGQKLVYSDLEKELGVSKTPIITALSRLEGEGYVRLIRNSGYYVREFTFEEVEDLLKARQALELANLDFVLARHTKDDLRDLERIHHEHTNYSSPSYDETRLANNRRFHLRIVAMGRNSLMIKYITHLYDFFDLKMKFNFSFLLPERLKEENVEHGQIVAALRQGSRIRLRKALRLNLASPIKDILRYMKDNQG